jgi:serine protease inhibitor
MRLPLSPKSPIFRVPGVTGASSSASTRFAFKLFRELTHGHDTNLLFSPSSVMLCALMIHDGAAGETRQAMAKALEIAELDPVDTQLTTVALKAAFGWQKDVEVLGANSLWCNQIVHVRPEFAARLREIYDAEIATLDFGSVDTIHRINAWVFEKTKGKIGELVNDLSPLAAVIALNAIYFKGLWTAPFERKLTSEGPFTTATGEVKPIPMMRQSGSYLYSEDRDLQAVVLPYKTDMAMYIILPAACIQRFQDGLSSGAWESMLPRFEMAEGTIQLPRFKVDCRVQLESALKNLGMERAFDRNRAEFDGIRCGHLPVWIEQVLHRAVAEVNEEGTIAAASTESWTYFGIEETPPPHFEMVVDRPFLVVIRDQTTGTLLFIGWIADPE